MGSKDERDRRRWRAQQVPGLVQRERNLEGEDDGVAHGRRGLGGPVGYLRRGRRGRRTGGGF